MLLSLDIGTSHTRLARANQGVVLSEPTMVADCPSLPIGIAVGRDVPLMQGKITAGMQLFQPFVHGHLAAPRATTMMLRALLKRLGRGARSIRLVVPTQTTAVEKAQLLRSVREAGATRVWVVSSSIACAHACGVAVSRTRSAAVLDIGASLTEIAVVSEQIVFRRGLRLGGSDFDEAVRDALNILAGVEVSLKVAREVKEAVGCAASPGDGPEITVTGRSRASGMPHHCTVPRATVLSCFEAPLQRLEELLRGAFDQLSPLVCKDIQEEGLLMTGGGALLAGLPEHLEKKLGIRVRRVSDPLCCAVLGALAVPSQLCEEIRP